MAKKKKHKLLAKLGLGLTNFGEGTNMKPIYGTLIGGGAAQMTSMFLGNASGGKYAANRELFGLGAGLAAAGALYATKNKEAAKYAAAGAFIGAGLAFLEKMFLGTVQLPAATAAAAVQAASGVSGLGMAQVRNLNGLGMAQVRSLNGLGRAAINQVRPAISTVPTAGMNGPQFAGSRLGNINPPVSLLGPQTSQSNQVSLLGGPQIHGLSTSYGATLLGGGR